MMRTFRELSVAAGLAVAGLDSATAETATFPIEGFSVNLPQATLIVGSTSPDRRWAIYHTTYRDTTKPAYLFASTDRRSAAGFAPWLHSIESGRLDRQPTNAVQVIWNRTSELVAIHDSASKHSSLHVYRNQNEKFVPLEGPNLLRAAFPHFSIATDPSASSGQVPLHWATNDLLMVTVRLRRQDGTRVQKLTIRVDPHNAVTVSRASP